MNFDSVKKWWKEKLFWLNHSINIMYPNDENVLMMPNQKKMDIIVKAMVILVDIQTLILKKGWKEMLFL